MASIKSTRGRKIYWKKVVLDVGLFPKARDLAMDEFSEMVVGIPRRLLHGATSPEITAPWWIKKTVIRTRERTKTEERISMKTCCGDADWKLQQTGQETKCAWPGSSKPVNMESPENLRSSKYVDKVSFLDLNNGRSDLDNWNWVFKTLLPGMPNMTARRQPNVSLTTKASELKPGSKGSWGSHLVLKMIGSSSQGGRNPLDPAPRQTCVKRQSPRSILSSHTIKVCAGNGETEFSRLALFAENRKRPGNCFMYVKLYCKNALYKCLE
ncbi:uncharacterized protein LOC117796929 [Ailuropoda melanoleuca]|uniref:uncharacterized protein LOC117796929 n=1 Tax=Ailuropoda melanoleuca TaxID=9646 RepID=UPI001493F47A|nr:uncharacterized protein LOC117796929 [Ailuropoda melanoleuca]